MTCRGKGSSNEENGDKNETPQTFYGLSWPTLLWTIFERVAEKSTGARFKS